MNVIAINEYENDWPVAVVKVPEGTTGEEIFLKWLKSKGSWAGMSDQKILEEALFAFSELKVIEIG